MCLARSSHTESCPSVLPIGDPLGDQGGTTRHGQSDAVRRQRGIEDPSSSRAEPDDGGT